MRGRFQFALLLFILPFLPFTLKTVLESRALFQLQPTKEVSEKVTDVRRQLLIGLDLLVRAERGLKQESSEYTRSLGRVPDVLGGLTYFYRVEITQATRDHLVVMALAEGRRENSASSAIMGDRVAIDDQFRVRSNFPLPSPPKAYLQVLAQTVMNRIEQNDFTIPKRSELDSLEGVFRGYFRYEVRPVSQGGRTVLAIGVADPVRGETVETLKNADLFEWAYHHRQFEWLDQEMYGQIEKVQMAERIHFEHTGNYTDQIWELQSTWESLASPSGGVSPIVIDELSFDPTFGYRAELTSRVLATEKNGSTAQRKPAAAPKRWSVNGYGQISEVSPIESVVTKFYEANRKLSVHGVTPGVLDAGVGESKSKPLIIDALDGEK